LWNCCGIQTKKTPSTGARHAFSGTIKRLWIPDLPFWTRRDAQPTTQKRAENIKGVNWWVILAVTADQALVFAAKVKADACHDRGKALFANTSVKLKGNRQARVAHKPFEPGASRFKSGNSAGAN
jgi:hypothetical protein